MGRKKKELLLRGEACRSTDLILVFTRVRSTSYLGQKRYEYNTVQNEAPMEQATLGTRDASLD